VAREQNTEQLKGDLRAALVPHVNSPKLIDSVIAFLNELPTRFSRDKLAAILVAHIARHPILRKQRDFVEQLINDRPLELYALVQQSYVDQALKFATGLPQLRPRRDKVTSPAERLRRSQQAKRRHDEWRSTVSSVENGLIEKQFSRRESGFSDPFKYMLYHNVAVNGPTCLDGLFSGQEVSMSTGANSLTRLLGIGRKSLPRSLPFRRQGKQRLYGCDALLMCMKTRLKSGRWLADPRQRQTVLTNVLQRAQQVASPEIVVQVQKALAPFLRP
jgi:hypothetical protein